HSVCDLLRRRRFMRCIRPSAMSPEMLTAIIAFFASTVTASLAYFFTKRQQIRMENRRLKEEFYRQFMKALSDVAQDNQNREANGRLSEGFNTLILIGSADVVNHLMVFHDFVKPDGSQIPRDSDEWVSKHDELLTALVKSMRSDLLGKDSD